MVYTFYIVSDEIQTKSKDLARMNKIASAFKAMGHKAVIGKRNPNAHSNPQQLKCTGKNDIFVCIFGGVDIEVISDHTGYKQTNWFKKRLKNAHLLYIFMSKPEGDAVSLESKKIGLAHDGKHNIPNLHSIVNPSSFLKKNGIAYIQEGTTDAVVQKIRNNDYKGAGLPVANGYNSEVTTNEYTRKRGYDCSTHFEGYLKIGYTLNNESKTRYIYVDFASESAETRNSFNNEALIFANDKQYTNEIPILKHLKSVHDPTDTKNYKYYLKSVSLVRKFDKEKFSDGQLYELKTDDATYKINLYSLGLSTGEAINPKKLGTSGKSLLEALKTCLNECNYYYKLHYGQYRNDDKIEFLSELDYTPRHTFDESINGDILGISNVKYSPTADLVNNSIIVYDNKIKENEDTKAYRFARKSRIREILRYGEQTHLENPSNSMGFSEASQMAYDKLNEYYKPDTTFTVTCEGFPSVSINDFVDTKTVNPILTNRFQVCSRVIKTDVNKRPMIQSEYGLGAIDSKLKVKHNLAEQRKKLVRQELDIDTAIEYYDQESESFIEYTNKSEDIDYVNYEVWVDD